MSDPVPELRRVAGWLKAWDPDEGNLLITAADRIEALEAEVGRRRDAFDRFLTACANREHEGMPRDEWEAEFLAAEEALAGEEDEDG